MFSFISTVFGFFNEHKGISRGHTFIEMKIRCYNLVFTTSSTNREFDFTSHYKQTNKQTNENTRLST